MGTKRRFVLLPLLALLASCTPESYPEVPVPTRVPLRSVPEFPSRPEDFVATIDNPYLAYQRGKVFRYRSRTERGYEYNVVEVTDAAKTILGVTTTVVHDQLFLGELLVEDTVEWFAQDVYGNVWCFGEDTKEVHGGKVVSTNGSWEAGVGGAMPGLVMLAQPEIGTRYAQEVAPGIAEDMARVASLTEKVMVPYGNFRCLKTVEWTPLQPGTLEAKCYAPGVGLVLGEARNNGTRAELVAIEDKQLPPEPPSLAPSRER